MLPIALKVMQKVTHMEYLRLHTEKKSETLIKVY